MLGSNTIHVCEKPRDPTFCKVSQYEYIVHLSCDFIVSLSRTLWGDGFGECTTCRVDGNPAWTCPAAVSTYADIGGSGANIVELDGGSGM